MRSPTCEVVHETKESSLQKSSTVSFLAQLSEHETDDKVVVGSNPTGGNLLQNLFCAGRSIMSSDGEGVSGMAETG